MRLATARQQFERAAVIFGLAERLRAEIRHMLDAPIRPLVEAALEQVHTELDEAAFAPECARGQRLSLDDGFAQVLRC